MSEPPLIQILRLSVVIVRNKEGKFLAVKEIGNRYPKAKRVGLLATHGTIADHVYENEIKKAGYEFVGPTDANATFGSSHDWSGCYSEVA